MIYWWYIDCDEDNLHMTKMCLHLIKHLWDKLFLATEKMCILCILGWNIVRRASPTKKINYDKDKERINEAEYMGIIFKPSVFTDGCCC